MPTKFASIGLPAVSPSSAYDKGRLVARALARRLGRRGEGFTLLEALVAIVVLALSLSVLMPSHNAGVRGLAAIDTHLQARLLAQSIMAEWANQRAVKPGTTHGQFETLSWTLSIAPLEVALAGRPRAGEWTLYKLVLLVSWPSGGQIELDTVRMGKTQ